MAYREYVLLTVYPCRALRAAVVIGVVCLPLTACGDSALTGGEVARSSYAPVPTEVVAEPGSPSVPSWWPEDVPLPKGRYRELRSAFLGADARALEVSDVSSASSASAADLLVSHGFVQQNLLGQDVYLNSRHTVTVAEVDNGGTGVLIYTLAAPMTLPGIPEMGDIDLDALLGGEG